MRWVSPPPKSPTWTGIPGRPGRLFPRRDHSRSPAGRRTSLIRPDPGRAEGHRQMDGEIGAGPRVPVTGIAEAVFSRALSGSSAQRTAATGLASGALGHRPSDAGQFTGMFGRHRSPHRSSRTRRFQPDSGRVGGTRLGASPGRLGDDLAGLHIIGEVPQPDQVGVRRTPDLPTLIAAPYFPRRRGIGDRRLAAGRRDRYRVRHSGPGLLRRRSPTTTPCGPSAVAGSPDPRSARLLRRSHVWTHRCGSGREISHLWSGDRSEVEV